MRKYCNESVINNNNNKYWLSLNSGAAAHVRHVCRPLAPQRRAVGCTNLWASPRVVGECGPQI